MVCRFFAFFVQGDPDDIEGQELLKKRDPNVGFPADRGMGFATQYQATDTHIVDHLSGEANRILIVKLSKGQQLDIVCKAYRVRLLG